MKIEKKDNYKIIINGNLFQIDKEAKIKDFLIIDNNLYILIDFPSGHKDQNCNIWKIDSDCNLVWKVKIFGSDVQGERPFVKMELKDKKLSAYNWVGVNFIVNTDNGDIEAIKGGRPW